MACTAAPLHLWDVLGFGRIGLWVGVVGLGWGGVCGTPVVEHYFDLEHYLYHGLVDGAT